MSEPLAVEQPRRERTYLSTGKLIALVFGMCVAVALVGATFDNLVPDKDNPGWKWVGILTTLVVACGLGLLIVYRFANPSLQMITGVFLAGAVGAVGTELGTRLGGEPWVARVGGFAGLIVGYMLWIMLLTKLGLAPRKP